MAGAKWIAGFGEIDSIALFVFRTRRGVVVDDGADSSRLNRDSFADTKTYPLVGVTRDLS